MTTCERVQELLPDYALGTLGGDEFAWVEAHLRVCRTCQAELAGYAIALDAMASALPDRKPPATVKANLMAVAQPPQKPALAARLSDGWANLTHTPGFAFKVACACLAVAVGLLGLQVSRLQGSLAAVTDRVLAQQQVIAVMATGSQVVRLNGTQTAPSANATLQFNPAGQMAVLAARDLPPLPAGKAYQLWLVNPDGTRDNGGVFGSTNGIGSLVINAPRPLGGYIRFGVTIEPATGSPGPTGAGVLRS